LGAEPKSVLPLVGGTTMEMTDCQVK